MLPWHPHPSEGARAPRPLSLQEDTCERRLERHRRPLEWDSSLTSGPRWDPPVVSGSPQRPAARPAVVPPRRPGRPHRDLREAVRLHPWAFVFRGRLPATPPENNGAFVRMCAAQLLRPMRSRRGKQQQVGLWATLSSPAVSRALMARGPAAGEVAAPARSGERRRGGGAGIGGSAPPEHPGKVGNVPVGSQGGRRAGDLLPVHVSP